MPDPCYFCFVVIVIFVCFVGDLSYAGTEERKVCSGQRYVLKGGIYCVCAGVHWLITLWAASVCETFTVGLVSVQWVAVSGVSTVGCNVLHQYSGLQCLASVHWVAVSSFGTVGCKCLASEHWVSVSCVSTVSCSVLYQNSGLQRLVSVQWIAVFSVRIVDCGV